MNRAREEFELLEAERIDLGDLLRQFEEPVLGTPGPNGGWCPMEIISHLMIAEESSIRYIERKMNDPESIAPAGLQSKLRSLALRIALRLPFRYEAPPVVASPGREASLDAAMARWDSVRGELSRLLESIPPGLGDRGIFRHPVSGRMNLVEMLRFHRAHLRRHRGQIERIVSFRRRNHA